ncbi:MAG: BON domain-containing protein [Verrucomicrobia bacterium]|nr:BON domain-containing protein [Verrucomicrobiota bacterium]
MKVKYPTIIYPVAFVIAAAALVGTGVWAFASDTDSRIESSAKQSYVFKTYLKHDAIKIQSKDGVATLTGTVAEDSHKTLAQETVANLPGVKSVDNQLESKAERAAENSDAWISARVKSSLLFHRNVSGTKTQVEVQNGIVTLRGEAASQAQKELTTEYAKDTEGVKDVKNEIRVVEKPEKSTETMGETMDNASITAQVKMTLLFHRSTSMLNTTVDTKDGTVTLGGKAKNSAEKDLVTKLVTDITGVKNVINNMTIEVVTVSKNN